MSRIGKKPITLPVGVTLEQTGRAVKVTGSRGELAWTIPGETKVIIMDNQISVTDSHHTRQSRALHGLTRQLLQTMVIGVSDGYRKQLEMKGTGYRAEVAGTDLVLSVGFSHPVRITAPEGIIFKVDKNILITVEGNSKQAVGEISAKIRSIRPPEPYKGKGIRYSGEIIRLKPGKAVKTASA